MKLPIDTGRMRFFCVKAAEPVLDFQTKRPRATRDGEPMYEVQVVGLRDDGESGLMTVRLVGEHPQKLAEGNLLTISGLVAVPWEIDGRSGISYRADRVEATTNSPATSSRSAS
ncbi:MAG: hypothetical protein M3O70_15850 [Actinomycetota bacterium]|nr:hypothetical protein [Actinomycetota bacterium]